MYRHRCIALPGIALLASLACSASGYACVLALGKPATTIVLLDMSKTIKDFASFQAAWNEVVDDAKDGDTVMLIKVKGDARNGQSGEFPYLARATMPCYSMFGTWAKYLIAQNATKKNLRGAFGAALQSERPNQTLLLNSLGGVAKYFAGRSGSKLLILETDGLEDYESTSGLSRSLGNRDATFGMGIGPAEGLC